MADYYSDDLDVESDQQFSEELLTDEEYDQLLATLPEVKKALSKYKKFKDIDELDIKECLYNNYFDVKESINELKATFKLKDVINTVQKNFQNESPDDKIQNAQKKAFDDFKKLDVKDTRAEEKKDKLLQQNVKVDIKSELQNNANFNKPHKSFVVIGHVDAGKSTLMGRLLLDLNIVDAKTVNKLVKDSESVGKGSFALAWVMDQTSEERSRGVTIDIVATNFESDISRFTAIDAPGHKDFIPQLINGVSQADVALLIVDSITGEFEAGFQLEGQTKEHTLIAKNLGITKLCCVINKLDKEEWSQDRFTYISEQLSDYLVNEIGYESSNLDFIPLSGLTGNNVVKNQKIKEFDWYKGQTLVEYLESIEVPRPNADEIITESFTLAINDVIDASSSEFVVSGKILSGVIQVNDNVSILPIEEIFKVTKVKMEGKSVKFSIAGEVVELSFSKKQFKEKSLDDILIGDILSNSTTIKSVKTFESKISLFNLKKPLLVGTPFVLFRNNFHIPAKLTKIIEIDNSKKKKKHLISKQSALVEITVDSDRLLPLTKYDENQTLGKIVIRREGVTIGAGTVVNLY